MIAFDKYGRMTPEFSKYQQATWDKIRELSEQITTQAIKDGVCPTDICEVMTKAIECGKVLASTKAYVNDHQNGSPECHMGLAAGL